MSDARHALMSAVFAALSGDATLSGLITGVFDHPPRGASHPFVSFGAFRSKVLDGDDVPDVEHRFEVLIHSRDAGRREASTIAARVEALLDGAALSLTGFRLIGLRHRESDVAGSRDQRAYRVRVSFSAVTEAV
ncbi:MAG: DUF3168 domain-containing protein [Pseudomonadota bacterium]